MIFSKATPRYAKTLFKVSLDKGNLDEIVKDMCFILKIIASTKRLKSFLANPIVKKDMLEQIFLHKIKGEIDPLTLVFFKLLIRKNRVSLFVEIPTAFIKYYESHKNILRATIKSAQKLSDEQLLMFKEKLKLRTGADDIHIKNIVDPKLIAGIQIKIGDTIIDANIKSKLIQLKQKLAA